MNASSNLMLEMAKAPAWQDRLREDPELIDDLIDESLRHRAPIHLFSRTVANPIEVRGRRACRRRQGGGRLRRRQPRPRALPGP